MTDRRTFGGTAVQAAPNGEDIREANKRTVLAFYDAALRQSDFAAAAVHFGPRYIQHNPMISDGIDGFRSFLHELKQQFPELCSDIKRVFADGDFVILHVHARRQPGDLGLAIVDIFRLENGKIVEHWDVRQPLGETAVHPNGMF
ncbi:nuclear transport factor 2 family protein [Bradyrhizobium diazoefficiens]|nr:nuclear transport factor 2 family protein [Bradyrhizobium diazoefficiens]QQO22355.1 nuclear transport factor 2 family protein [Bradyrhizobium diazoefficiens]